MRDFDYEQELHDCEQCIYYKFCHIYIYDNYGCNHFKDIANYAEVKHGRWYLADNGVDLVCSECNGSFGVFFNELMRFKYCPNCGAYMRETYGDKNEIQA